MYLAVIFFDNSGEAVHGCADLENKDFHMLFVWRRVTAISNIARGRELLATAIPVKTNGVNTHAYSPPDP